MSTQWIFTESLSLKYIHIKRFAKSARNHAQEQDITQECPQEWQGSIHLQ